MQWWSLLAYVLIGSTAQQRHQGEECNPNTRLISKSELSASDYEFMALSSDGRKLAGARKVNYFAYSIEVWDAIRSIMLISRVVPTYERPLFVTFSPRLGYAWLGNSDGRVLDIKTGASQHICCQMAWSRDEELMAVINSNYMVEIHNSTSGEMLRNWKVPFEPIGLCWTASSYISIIGSGTNFTGIIRYHPNGTIAIMRAFPVRGRLDSSSCSSDGLVAAVWKFSEEGVQVIDVAENVQVFLPLAGYVLLGVNFLVICANLCTLYDTGLQPLLALPGTEGQLLVGLVPDESNLITYLRGTLYRWDTQTPSLRVFPYDGSQILMWSDRDWFLNGIREFNVRENRWESAIPFSAITPDLSNFCLMQGMIYAKTGNSTIRVFAHGSQNEVRSWNLPSGWIFAQSLPIRAPVCSSQGDQVAVHAFDSVRRFHWLVWTSDGLVLQDIEMKQTDWTEVYQAAFYNTSQLVIVNSTLAQFWNPQTSSWSPPVYRGVYEIEWSPNGEWLLIIHSGVVRMRVTILYSNRTVAMETEDTSTTGWRNIASWSPDNNWLIVAGAPPLIVSPKLKQIYHLDGITANSVFWNPVTMEVMSVDIMGNRRWQLWVPMPLIVGLIAASHTDVQAPGTVAVLGGNFLPPIVKAMLRWVDSSTNVPQCMFTSATVVDAFTLSLGNIALPDPGVYTVHIHSSSLQPTSAWLSSQSQFTAICGGPTRAAFSVTGGLTKCECLAAYYTVPQEDDARVKCEDCPEHGNCDGSTVVKSDEGYWPKIEDPYQFLSCAAGACPGDNLCSPCHEGPRCGLCSWGVETKCGQHGYGRCQECNPVWQDILIIILGLICWIILCIIQSLFALGWRNNKRRGNNSAQLAAIIVSTTQVNALLLSVDASLAPFSNVLGLAEERVPGGGVQSAVFSCIFINYGLSPAHVHFMKQVVMLVMPFVGWVMLLLIRGCLQCRGILTSPDIVKVPTVVMWASLQSAVTTSLFQTLSCSDVESQGFKQRLSHDISVACFGNTYWRFIGIVTIPAIILTIFVIPPTFSWLLRHRPSASQSGSLRFLVKSYRMDWWYLIICYRKVVLAIVVTFTRSSIHVAVALLLAGAIHIMVWPSTSFLVNVSEAISLLSSSFIFAAVGVRRGDIDNIDGVFDMLFVVVLSYCIQVGLLVYDRWWQTSSAESKDAMKIVFEPLDQYGGNSDNRHYSRMVQHT